MDISSNFKQYDLGIPEIIRGDNAMSCMRTSFQVDAIITDPPYGVRAGARKTGVPQDVSNTIPGERAFCMSCMLSPTSHASNQVFRNTHCWCRCWSTLSSRLALAALLVRFVELEIAYAVLLLFQRKCL